jgi:hypothetical protein
MTARNYFINWSKLSEKVETLISANRQISQNHSIRIHIFGSVGQKPMKWCVQQSSFI